MEYKKYLKSEKWAEKKKLALDSAKRRCQLCNSKDNLHVHHRTYENVGNELPTDLTVLCKTCHESFHKTQKFSYLYELVDMLLKNRVEINKLQ